MRQLWSACFIFIFISSFSVRAESPLTQSALQGIWEEKSGDAVYMFDDAFNFEYRRVPNAMVQGDKGSVEKGVWTLAPDNCTVGPVKGNLYIQVGTDRCCHQAYFLGSNLVLTAVGQPPIWAHVCRDRVLIRQALER